MPSVSAVLVRAGTALRWLAVFALGVLVVVGLGALPLIVFFVLQELYGVDSAARWSGALITVAVLWLTVLRLAAVERAILWWMAWERRLWRRMFR